MDPRQGGPAAGGRGARRPAAGGRPGRRRCRASRRRRRRSPVLAAFSTGRLVIGSTPMPAIVFPMPAIVFPMLVEATGDHAAG
jgi:hypothetical protein